MTNFSVSAGGKHLLRQGSELRGPAAASALSLWGRSVVSEGEAALSPRPAGCRAVLQHPAEHGPAAAQLQPLPHKDAGVGNPPGLEYGVRGAAGGGAGRAPLALPSRGVPRQPPAAPAAVPPGAAPRRPSMAGRRQRPPQEGGRGTSPTPSIFNHYLNPRGNEQTSRLGALGIFSAVGRIYPERVFHNKLFLG